MMVFGRILREGGGGRMGLKTVEEAVDGSRAPVRGQSWEVFESSLAFGGN